MGKKSRTSRFCLYRDSDGITGYSAVTYVSWIKGSTTVVSPATTAAPSRAKTWGITGSRNQQHPNPREVPPNLRQNIAQYIRTAT